MDEYEKLEKDLQQQYEVYMERFRNLDYLENELDMYNKVQANLGMTRVSRHAHSPRPPRTARDRSLRRKSSRRTTARSSGCRSG